MHWRFYTKETIERWLGGIPDDSVFLDRISLIGKVYYVSRENALKLRREQEKWRQYTYAIAYGVRRANAF
jgi:hypothetical protein